MKDNTPVLDTGTRPLLQVPGTCYSCDTKLFGDDVCTASLKGTKEKVIICSRCNSAHSFLMFFKLNVILMALTLLLWYFAKSYNLLY